MRVEGFGPLPYRVMLWTMVDFNAFSDELQKIAFGEKLVQEFLEQSPEAARRAGQWASRRAARRGAPLGGRRVARTSGGVAIDPKTVQRNPVASFL